MFHRKKKQHKNWIEKKWKSLIKRGDTFWLEEYVNYLYSPGRILLNNFLLGIARGFGIIIGMTVVVALFTIIIKALGGLPVIGDIFQWIGEKIGDSQEMQSLYPPK